jgi:hypothetical protein
VGLFPIPQDLYLQTTGSAYWNSALIQNRFLEGVAHLGHRVFSTHSADVDFAFRKNFKENLKSLELVRPKSLTPSVREADGKEKGLVDWSNPAYRLERVKLDLGR